MKLLVILLTLLCRIIIPACAQPATTQKADIKVGGPCEAVYECPVPFDQLNEVDTLPDFSDAGPKIGISGTVYTADGKTAAAAVIIYIYHRTRPVFARGKEQKKAEDCILNAILSPERIVPATRPINISGYKTQP